jgi:hypothetical protein
MAVRNRAIEGDAHSPEDDFWNSRPEARLYAAIAVHLICQLPQIGPSQIVSAAPRGTNRPLKSKAVTLLRASGEDFCKNASALDQCAHLIGDAPAMYPNRKFGDLVTGLLALADRNGTRITNAFLREVLDELRRVQAQSKASAHNTGEAQAGEEPDPPPIRGNPEKLAQALQALQFLKDETGIDLAALQSVHTVFTGKDPSVEIPSELHFDCFRFHSHNQHVVQSFMAIKFPDQREPATTFVNLWRGHADSPRRSRGLVLSGGPGLVYFLGTIGHTGALKVMAMEAPPQPQDTYVGIGLSTDEDGRAMTSRFLLKRSQATKDSEANIGELTLADARTAIGDEGIDKIRNRIEFHHDPGLDIRVNGRAIKADKLESELMFALRKPKGGGFTFTLGEDVEFNPLDPQYFSFNAALVSWRREGD